MDIIYTYNLEFITIIFALICIFMGFAFLFLKTSTNEALKNYRIARIIMAFSYLIMAVMLILGLILPSAPTERKVVVVFYLWSSIFQAFLFNYTLITLLNKSFHYKKKMIWEVSCIAILVLIGIIAINSPAKTELAAYIYSLSIFYLFLIIRYSILFFNEYRGYIQKFENYFSDQERYRLQWVKYSFIGGVIIGIMALEGSLSTRWIDVFITTIISVYYFLFGIRFINYSNSFLKIEPILVSEEEPKTAFSVANFADLSDRVSSWIDQKKFVTRGITIDRVAKDIGSNRNYLSFYVNNKLNKSFRGWINELRIEEAKNLIKEDASLSLIDICERVGYTDISNFGKQFARHTGKSPSKWMKNLG